MDLLDRVASARGKRVLLALSGGADSVALLLLLSQAGAEVSCAHFEHGIRGGDSLRDRDFCRRLCRELQVRLIEGTGRVPKNQMPGEGLELAARRLRYQFLRRAKEEAGAEWIALAHHMDDQAETVLMHLFRGAGLRGLGGMRELSGDLYRPLLGVSKRELVEYLEKRGQPFCRDESNFVPDTPRNLLRLKLLPEIQSAYPGCAEAISRFSSLARRDEDFLARLAREWLEERRQTGPYGLRLLLDGSIEEAVASRALRDACQQAGAGEIEWRHVRALLEIALSKRRKAELPGGLVAERAGKRLYLLRPLPHFPLASLALSGETRIPGLCRVWASAWEGGPIRGHPYRQALSRRALRGAVLRTRLPGDWIRPLGMVGTKPLSDYMADRGMDRPLRDWTPLVAAGREILWVAGLGISESAKLAGGEAVRLDCIIAEE